MNEDGIDDLDDLNDEIDINVDSISVDSKKKDTKSKDEKKDNNGNMELSNQENTKVDKDNKVEEKKESNGEEEEDYGGFEDPNIPSQEGSILQNNGKQNEQDIKKNKLDETNNPPSEKNQKEEIDDNYIDKILSESDLKKEPQLKKKTSHTNKSEKCLSKKNSKCVSDGNSHSQSQSNSKLDFSEAGYYILKTELENILAKDTFSTPEEISKQNEEMIFYLKKLNDTLTLLVNNSTSQIENIKPVVTQDEQKKKMVDVYKREYLRLETRLKQLTDPVYEENLTKNLNNLNLEIAKIENENKNLRISQKQSEIMIDKQSQNVNRAEVELKRLQMDYDNIISQQNLITEKINKTKITIKDNDAKIKQLNEWQEKLEKIAKEMYDIKEYENVQLEEEKEKTLNDKKNALLKNYEVYQKVLKTNNKKYEIEIAKNEKIIFGLEKHKSEMLQKYKGITGEDYYKTNSRNNEQSVYNHKSNLLGVNNPQGNGDNVSFGLGDDEKEQKIEKK